MAAGLSRGRAGKILCPRGLRQKSLSWLGKDLPKPFQLVRDSSSAKATPELCLVGRDDRLADGLLNLFSNFERTYAAATQKDRIRIRLVDRARECLPEIRRNLSHFGSGAQVEPLDIQHVKALSQQVFGFRSVYLVKIRRAHNELFDLKFVQRIKHALNKAHGLGPGRTFPDFGHDPILADHDGPARAAVADNIRFQVGLYAGRCFRNVFDVTRQRFVGCIVFGL